jgi:methionyl-tRNA formyltransferase
MKVGPAWFVDQLKLYLGGYIKSVPQSGTATSAPSIKPTDRIINWHESATNVRARIHALSNFPCCTIRIGQFRIKPLYAILESSELNTEPGILLNTKKLVIACKQSAIRITQLIPENGKAMSDEDFCRGRKLYDIVRVDD